MLTSANIDISASTWTAKDNTHKSAPCLAEEHSAQNLWRAHKLTPKSRQHLQASCIRINHINNMHLVPLIMSAKRALTFLLRSSCRLNTASMTLHSSTSLKINSQHCRWHPVSCTKVVVESTRVSVDIIESTSANLLPIGRMSLKNPNFSIWRERLGGWPRGFYNPTATCCHM